MAFAGAQASVHFVSKPNTKTPGGGRAAAGRPSRPGNLPSPFPAEPSLLSPEKGNSWPHEGVGDSGSSGLPTGPSGVGFGPGGFTSRRPPPTPPAPFQIRKLDAPRCGCRPRPARGAREGARYLGLPRRPGGGGRGPLWPPKAALARGGAKGSLGQAGPPARPVVAIRSLQAREPRAAGTGSPRGLPAFPRQLPGRGEAGARMGAKKARPAGPLKNEN